MNKIFEIHLWKNSFFQFTILLDIFVIVRNAPILKCLTSVSGFELCPHTCQPQVWQVCTKLARRSRITIQSRDCLETGLVRCHHHCCLLRNTSSNTHLLHAHTLLNIICLIGFKHFIGLTWHCHDFTLPFSFLHKIQAHILTKFKHTFLHSQTEKI